VINVLQNDKWYLMLQWCHFHKFIIINETCSFTPIIINTQVIDIILPQKDIGGFGIK
jgi:hypothetical protein